MGTRALIVDNDSATLGVRERKQSIPANHSRMCRFKSARDPGYVRVSGGIFELVEDALEELSVRSASVESVTSPVRQGPRASLESRASDTYREGKNRFKLGWSMVTEKLEKLQETAPPHLLHFRSKSSPDVLSLANTGAGPRSDQSPIGQSPTLKRSRATAPLSLDNKDPRLSASVANRRVSMAPRNLSSSDSEAAKETIDRIALSEDLNLALSWACEAKNSLVAQYTLIHGASVDAEDSEGNSALIRTLEKGYEPIAWLLIGCGAAVESKGEQGQTAVISAARWGLLNTVTLLHEKHALINETDNDGTTDLMYAAASHHFPTMKLLLRIGANVNAEDNIKSTALIEAINGDTDDESESPSKQQDIIRTLLDHRAVVDHKTQDGLSAPHFACRVGHSGIVQLLINRRAEINAKGSNMITPLQEAAAHGHEQTIRLLIAEGANINYQGSATAQTALIMATRNHQKSASSALVELGASVYLKDDCGKTAEDYARERKLEELLSVLRL